MAPKKQSRKEQRPTSNTRRSRQGDDADQRQLVAQTNNWNAQMSALEMPGAHTFVAPQTNATPQPLTVLTPQGLMQLVPVAPGGVPPPAAPPPAPPATAPPAGAGPLVPTGRRRKPPRRRNSPEEIDTEGDDDYDYGDIQARRAAAPAGVGRAPKAPVQPPAGALTVQPQAGALAVQPQAGALTVQPQAGAVHPQAGALPAQNQSGAVAAANMIRDVVVNGKTLNLLIIVASVGGITYAVVTGGTQLGTHAIDAIRDIAVSQISHMNTATVIGGIAGVVASTYMGAMRMLPNNPTTVQRAEAIRRPARGIVNSLLGRTEEAPRQTTNVTAEQLAQILEQQRQQNPQIHIHNHTNAPPAQPAQPAQQNPPPQTNQQQTTQTEEDGGIMAAIRSVMER